MRVLFLLSLTAFAFSVKEYVGIAPNSGAPGVQSTAIEWISLEYDSGVSSAKDVTMSTVTSAPAELGNWFGLDPGGLSLSAKILDNTLYALNDDSGEGEGGCCADMLRMHDRDTGAIKTIDLDSVVASTFNSTDAHVSHTFDVTILCKDYEESLTDCKTVVLLVIKYYEESLNYPPTDAILAIDVATSAVVPTADGLKYFDIYEQAGTLSTDAKETRFKVQYYTNYGSGSEEWHANGVARFTPASGQPMMAFTHRSMAEAIIFQCPWTYKAAAGGGTILQRFGTPWKWTTNQDQTRRYFGLSTSEPTLSGGVHNVFYRRSSEALGGAESISMFSNSQKFTDGSGTKAAGYEFELKPVTEGSAADPGDDTVFNASYVYAKCSFAAQAQGGTRAIGNGVFIFAGGAGFSGFELADTAGNYVDRPYSSGTPPIYDPFLRVVVSDSQ